MQTVVAKRINSAKPLSEENKVPSSKSVDGSRKMTILSCANGRQQVCYLKFCLRIHIFSGVFFLSSYVVIIFIILYYEAVISAYFKLLFGLKIC